MRAIGLLILGMTGLASAQEPSLEMDADARARLEHLAARAAEVRAKSVSLGELTRMDQPVLRYTNPVRSSQAGGVVYLWLHGVRPQCAGCFSIRDNGNVIVELSSLARDPLDVTYSGDAPWTPRQAGLPPRVLKQAPEPAESARLRLPQLREQARRFKVFVEKGQWIETRLLTQPLHRWESAADGIIDGAIFCFAETTDPEIALVVEIRRDAPTQDVSWEATIAKMTAPTIKVEHDGLEIWHSGGPYWRNPRAPTDSYMEAVIGRYEGAPSPEPKSNADR